MDADSSTLPGETVISTKIENDKKNVEFYVALSSNFFFRPGQLYLAIFLRH